jgi:signal transduction histidine kinase
VSVRIVPGKEDLTLFVDDNGRGMTPDKIEQAFEPYFRGAGGGAGLGLSIAREIIHAHGGRIWLKARQEGGTEAAFSLPRPPVTVR